MKLRFDLKNNRGVIFRGHTVMSRAEEPYMQTLIGLLASKDIENVLEIGYGPAIMYTCVNKQYSSRIRSNRP